VTPNEPNIVTATCAIPGCAGQTAGQDDTTAAPVELVIQPSPGFVNVGDKWLFKAILNFSDGSSQDVTDAAEWDSSANNVATVDAGQATGVDIGLATISATYNNFQAFAQITVVTECTDSGCEITLCLGRDTAMQLNDRGQKRIDLIRAGAIQLVESLNTATDKAALVSFAGRKLNISPTVQQTQSEATTDCDLTNDQDALKAALANYKVRGFTHSVNTVPNIIGIGGGLQLALSVATGPKHVVDRKQVIVLVVDGRNAVASPDETAVADEIKDANIHLVIIGISIPDDYSATLRSMASDGNYFGVGNASDAASLLARTPHAFCDGYSFIPPTDPGNGNTQKSDQTITFDPIPDENVTAANRQLNANASSGLPVTFAVVSGNATLVGDGTVVHVSANGPVTIRATQAGNDAYNPAPSVDRTFMVYPDTAEYIIQNYVDTMFSACSVCSAKSGGSSPWDGTFISAPTGPQPSRLMSLNFSAGPGDSGDTTVYSINDKAFKYAKVYSPFAGMWVLTIYCSQGGTSRDIWNGIKSGNTPEGVYTFTAIEGGQNCSSNIPPSVKLIAL
jgi:hypothetical protein